MKIKDIHKNCIVILSKTKLQTPLRKGVYIPKFGQRTAEVLKKQLSVEAYATEKDLRNPI